MGKYQLEYGALNELAEEFAKMDETLKGRIKETGKAIGTQLKHNTESAMPKSAGIATHGTHMADDVKLSVTTNDKKTSITVKGGKETGSLWFIVDNGHIAQNGHFIQGAHFTDKAYRATDVVGPVDKLIGEIANE